MPGRGPQTFKKRQKEQERKERRQEKLAKRLAKKHNRDGEPESGDSVNETESPDASEPGNATDLTDAV